MNLSFPFTQEELLRLTTEYMQETYGPVKKSANREFYHARLGQTYDVMTYLRDRALLQAKPDLVELESSNPLLNLAQPFPPITQEQLVAKEEGL